MNYGPIKGELVKTYERSGIENFKQAFCPQLMNRIYPLIKWMTECDGEILLLLNIYDRSLNAKAPQLIYGGLKEQIKFLDIKPNKEVKRAIESLSGYELPLGGGKVTSILYGEFEEGYLALKDVTVGSLNEYFSSAGKDEYGNLLNEQKFEYQLLVNYFDIGKDSFLSLPLIQFGHFDGVIHIIFQAKDISNFQNTNTKKLLIRQLSMVYEELLLAWDLVGYNIAKKSTIREQLDYLTSLSYEQASTTNPIFKELRYRQYYEESYDFLLERIERTDIIPDRFKKEHRRRAIISVLIDSFAHNISAHSLTVLKWWFQQRAQNDKKVLTILEKLTDESDFIFLQNKIEEYLNQKSVDGYPLDSIGKTIKIDFARWINMIEERRKQEEFLPVRDQLLPLTDQLHPLFRFLLEKGAFWSGVTRDQQFGGEVRNLYDVLWNDFINNPLYLGTIAYSEKITQLNIHIRIYSGRIYSSSERDDFKRTYEIERNENGVMLDGIIGKINVKGKNTINPKYVEQGEKFLDLKEKLKSCEIFLPGGVVGKHALFTLIENEIRNVKHFPHADISKMRKDGLNIFIGIRPGSLTGTDLADKKINNKPLYKIGIWLGHKSDLYNIDRTAHLVINRLERLKMDIITPDTNQPRLGGSFQDKICAAMLLNNTFISVEEKTTTRDKNYYPWLRAAFSTGLQKDGLTEIDFEVRDSNLQMAKGILSDPHKEHAEGYFKKYFHVWQAAPVYHLTNLEALEVENISRFKIVTTQKKEWVSEIRAKGIVRVVDLNSSVNISWEKAYGRWLSVWLKEDQFSIRLKQGETIVGYIFYDRSEASYYAIEEYWDLNEEQEELMEEYATFPYTNLRFAHGKTPDGSGAESNFLTVRNHGVLVRKFFDGLTNINEFDEATITQAHLLELLEVLQTKICIFDKRIADRVAPERQRSLFDQLNCGVYGEEKADWNTIKKGGLAQYHFIIMHLSFIEGMKDKNGTRYGEERIVEFIENEIGGELSENCVLVVTTGRGREQWWRSLKESEHKAYTTFRPVESLIEAVETAILKKDEIEMKYNLVKVLLGS